MPERMARTGHGRALEERRLNFGHQTLPSGLSAFPVARNSEFHRSINQRLPELWSDFSNPSRSEANEQSTRFHGDGDGADAAGKAQQVLFVGYAEFDMDGRVHTAGEMDRLMLHAASAKYPCSRPATFDEYSEGNILGLPKRNLSGRDIVFVGPGATGCELNHTNTLGSQKAMVSPGDHLDGTWGAASMYGRKCLICVYPVARLKKQQSLMQFGLARQSAGSSGRLRRAGSLTTLSDKTQWTSGDCGVGGAAMDGAAHTGPHTDRSGASRQWRRAIMVLHWPGLHRSRQ